MIINFLYFLSYDRCGKMTTAFMTLQRNAQNRNDNFYIIAIKNICNSNWSVYNELNGCDKKFITEIKNISRREHVMSITAIQTLAAPAASDHIRRRSRKGKRFTFPASCPLTRPPVNLPVPTLPPRPARVCPTSRPFWKRRVSPWQTLSRPRYCLRTLPSLAP